MPREFHRTDRVGAQMQRELSQLIQRDLGRSDLTMVTLQEVRVVRDFSKATVYFTLLGDDLDPKEIQQELADLAGHLRHELGRRMRLRALPELEFVYDSSVGEGERLASLIARVNQPEK